jgi:single-strand DNA-binding protein
MNTVVLVGRTTRDIELRRTGNGTAVASFTLAVNRDFKTNDGQEADFIQCVSWKKTAELLEQYVHKGDRIAVNGSIRTRNYEDSHGRTVYVTEVLVNHVEFLETKNREQSNYNNNGYTDSDNFNDNENFELEKDDLPF